MEKKLTREEVKRGCGCMLAAVVIGLAAFGGFFYLGVRVAEAVLLR